MMLAPCIVPPSMCFTVKCVLGVAGEGNSKSYMVQWEPTWVHATNLFGCQQLIEDFLHKEREVHVQECSRSSGEGVAEDEVITTECVMNEVEADQESIPLDTSVESIPSNAVVENSNDLDDGVGNLFMEEPLTRIKLEDNYDAAVVSDHNARDEHFEEDYLLEVPTEYDDDDDNTTRSMVVNHRNDTLEFPMHLTDMRTETEMYARSHNSDFPTHNKIIKLNSTPSNISYLHHYRAHTSTTNTRTTNAHHRSDTISYPPQSEQKGGWEMKRKGESSDRPYICNVCNKCFSGSTDLQRHTLTHSGIKPHKCMECGKAFGLKGNLKRHMLLVHTGIRPFSCEHCTRAFTTKSNLASHVRKNHIGHIVNTAAVIAASQVK